MHKDHTTQAKPKKDEREEVLKEIRQLENRQKILENKQRNEERKARTRRLIERGAILEGIFPLTPDLPGIEHHFPEQVISPEDILMEKETEREQEAAHALMMERLREALATLTPRQASCLHARFWEGKQFKEIAKAEGFTTSAAIVTVRNAIIKLQKYYIRRGWMKPPKEKAICTKTAPPKRNRKKTSAKKS